jgi:hypothetical protein
MGAASPNRVLLLAALTLCLPASCAVLRVAANAVGPGHDGTTWAQAFATVQSALSAAAPGDELWVAAGTYPENVTVPSGVDLYGGFKGDEAARGARVWWTNLTVLDGANKASVVTIPDGAADITLDGFVITNGAGSYGAGIRCLGDSVVVSHNVIRGNHAVDPHWSFGGGVYASGRDVVISDNEISGNVCETQLPSWSMSVSFGGGGGIATGPYPAIIRGNTVFGNAARLTDGNGDIYGGGIVCAGGLVQNNNVSANETTAYGYILTWRGYFNTGTAEDGGLSVTDTRVEGNLIANNLVRGYYDQRVSAIRASGASTLVNNTIVRNAHVNGSDGAVTLGDAVTLANNVIALNGPVGVVAPTAAAARIRNNDVWSNAVNYAWSNGTGYVGSADLTNRNGNISADPQFVDRSAANYRLLPGSPCVNAGDDASAAGMSLDFSGAPRLQGAHVDMGTYELAVPSGTVRRVKLGASGPTFDGRTWATAYASVRDALSACAPNDELWVSAGTYTGNLTIPPGVRLYGGFRGDETARYARSWKSNVSILDGGRNGSVVVVPAGAADVIIDGFTITNGKAAAGGGVNSAGDRTSLSHNLITGNAAEGEVLAEGGGVYLSGAYASVQDSTVSGNTVTTTSALGSQAHGGGVASVLPASIRSNAIHDNAVSATGGQAVSRGGGLFLPSGGDVVGNRIEANTLYGWGLVCQGSCTSAGGAEGGGAYALNARLAGNVIAGNTIKSNGGSHGAAVYCPPFSTSPPPGLNLLNNTIVGNRQLDDSAPTDAAVALSLPSILVNNVLAVNSPWGLRAPLGSEAGISNNDVWGNGTDYVGIAAQTGLQGNISTDPLVAADGSYGLLPGSPCIDTGVDDAPGPAVDINGDPRRRGAHVDMGAVEMPSALTLADVRLVLRIACGLEIPSSADYTRLNIVRGIYWDKLEITDAVCVARNVLR